MVFLNCSARFYKSVCIMPDGKRREAHTVAAVHSLAVTDGVCLGNMVTVVDSQVLGLALPSAKEA